MMMMIMIIIIIQTWTNNNKTNRPVDKESKPVRGYRRRMHNIWKEQYGT